MSYAVGTFLHDTMRSALDDIAETHISCDYSILAEMTPEDLADDWITWYGDDMGISIVGQYTDDGDEILEPFTRDDLVRAFKRLRDAAAQGE